MGDYQLLDRIPIGASLWRQLTGGQDLPEDHYGIVTGITWHHQNGTTVTVTLRHLQEIIDNMAQQWEEARAWAERLPLYEPMLEVNYSRDIEEGDLTIEEAWAALDLIGRRKGEKP